MRQRPRAGSEAPAPPAPPAAGLPQFGPAWRLLLLPACLLAPAAGLALGALYAAQPGGTSRRFGWACLALALAGTLLSLAARSGHFTGWGGGNLLQPFY